jgi:Immunoglobulin domain
MCNPNYSMKTRNLILLSAATLAAFVCLRAEAQVQMSAGTYSQNFDTLASSGTANAWTDNSTLPGWYASKTLGGATISTYRADTGSGNAGALYSFGASSAAERALGSIGSGTPGNFAYGVRLVNDTAQAVNNITISYTGEQWRNGGNNAPAQPLTFSYLVSASPITSSDAGATLTWTAVPALDFISPTFGGTTAAALDGNAAANQHVFSGIVLPGVSVLPGQEIFLRWLDINDAGNDHALAIDNLTVSFTGVPPVTNPPAITTQPVGHTSNAGSTATFTVEATGSAPLVYQWIKDGNLLFDVGNVAGSAGPTLTITNLTSANAGSYSVVITNDAGAVTSSIVSLVILDPAINQQPSSRTNVIGDTANFFASAAGAAPLSYQWRHNGADIPNATTATLNVANVQAADQGSYQIVVSNPSGSVTSAVATLTLKSTPSTQLARWDFNATNVLSAASPAPSVGAGTALTVVGANGSFAGGSFSDAAGVPGAANNGWNTQFYPAQGTGNKTAGVQFNVSTVGYQNVLLTWEQRHSNTASKYERLQYSIDGINFIDGDVIVMNAINNSFVFYSSDLSSIPGVNNNPNFAFRIVAEFESTAIGTTNENYVGTVGTYNAGTGGGTIRFDLVNVFGDTVGTAPSAIPLNITATGSSVTLSWTNAAFKLQSATSVAGPFSDVAGATSPYTTSATGAQNYFRLKY